jgi:glycosyltransferase involved in cell wall biosynthesis
VRGGNDTGVAQKVLGWVDGSEKPAPAFVKRKSKLSYWRVPAFYMGNGGSVGEHPAKQLAQGARYMCVSQYPLSENKAFDWLRQRPDVKAVFFLHDMLPLEFPEYFRPSERARHVRRMQNVAQHAAGLLVSTQNVKSQVLTYMKELGRGEIPIHIAPVPLAPAFLKHDELSAKTKRPYFISCGTIEPRKNHLLLLNIWREIAQQLGPDTPKLILVGTRGWENENVIDMLERSPAITDHVIELNSLSTPALVHLMRGARAVLMPTFGEGFGLPVAEALSLGLRVVASDIPVFREVTQGHAKLISPLDGMGWKKEIMNMMYDQPDAKLSRTRWQAPELDFQSLDAFLASL